MADVFEDLVEQVRDFYVRYNETKGGCAVDSLDHCAEDVRWNSLGGDKEGVEFLQGHVGREGLKTYFAALFDAWDMDFFTVTDIIAKDERIVVLADVKFTFKATGKSIETKKADVYRTRDGEIVEFFEYFDTAAMEAATCP